MRTTWMIGALLCFGITACGDDDGAATNYDAGDQDSGGGACVNLAGNWEITEHCGGDPIVGMVIPVTQTDCTVTTGGAFAGFTGTVGEDGAFTLAGMGLNGQPVSCIGTATATTITESCTGNCDVTMQKQ